MREEILSDDVRVILGDCREVLPTLDIDAFVTDPPRDQAKNIPGADDPRGLFSSVAPLMAQAKLVAVQIGCYSDPCFLAPLAERMPFIHACWLRYIPPSYNGRVIVDADVAYVYGTPPKSREGARVLPSMCQSTGREEFLKRHGKNRTSAEAADTLSKMDHPMPRCIAHVRWLVGWHTEAHDVVCDPFLGSGTTGDACVQLGRKFIGIETDPRFFDVSCFRISGALRQSNLFVEKRKPATQEIMKL